MANIILRANIGDSNVNVEYKVLPLPLSNNEVELIISPAQGYFINKDSFSHGHCLIKYHLCYLAIQVTM